MLPISVIIPIYNHERYIAQCLRSVADGGTQPQEIILVDNASTDGSVAVAEALRLPNLIVVRNDRNLGATQARHIGLSRASCDSFFFLDSDDWLGPGALELAYRDLVKRDLDASLFTMFRMSEDQQTVLFSLEPPPSIISGYEAFEMTLGGWRIDSRGLYRRSLYDRAFPKLECTGHSDDEVLTRLIFLEGRRLGGSTAAYYYRLVDKPPTIEMVIGQVRTNLRALELAGEYRHVLSSDQPLRDMRNVVSRNLLGLAMRIVKARGNRQLFGELQRTYASVPVPWRRSDLKFLMMDRLVAALSAVRLSD